MSNRNWVIWTAGLAAFAVASPSFAECTQPPGDLDGSMTTNVTDVQCAILAALWDLDGGLGPLPLCLGASAAPADANCDGGVTVADVQIVILNALGSPLSNAIDADGSGCVDACEPGCGDGVADPGLGEQCDDGNLEGGDGCDAQCQEEPPPCPKTWLLTYDVTGTFTITDTPLGAGNAANPIGYPGTLVLRVADVGGAPGGGPVQLVSYTMDSVFTVDSFGLSITTDITAHAGPDACGVALGVLSGNTVTWDPCVYGAGHGTTSWSPASAASGPGCVSDYTSEGELTCTSSSPFAPCSLAGLSPGLNAQFDQWDQPLNWLVFDPAAGSLAKFHMGDAGGPAGSSGDKGVEVPNDTTSRTWFTLDGALVESQLVDSPACLCP